MCLGAMVHARIEKVVFGAFDERTGVCGSCQDLSEIQNICIKLYNGSTVTLIQYVNTENFGHCGLKSCI
jgi:tRNA(Arg) A34 adenosine deaminase TadA